MIRRIWWVFAIDAVIYVVNLLMFSPDVWKLDASSKAFDIYSYAAVTIAALFTALYSGKIFSAIKMGALFWFVWRLMLFLIVSVFDALLIETGSLDFKFAMVSAFGYVFAQVLVFPIVLVLCGSAGWLGKSRAIRGQ